jgi:hypothetical protein
MLRSSCHLHQVLLILRFARGFHEHNILYWLLIFIKPHLLSKANIRSHRVVKYRGRLPLILHLLLTR